MTPLTQTVLACPIRQDGHDENGVAGDCWRTVLACILDKDDPREVPHFLEEEGEEDAAWWHASVEWMNAQGYHLIYLGEFPLIDEVHAWWDEYKPLLHGVIVGGPSPRGPFNHVVVGSVAPVDVVHDPHPSRAGLLSIDEIFVVLRKES